MKTSNYRIDVVNGRAWASLSRTRPLEDAPVPEVLRWIIEQLYLGNSENTVNEDGQLIALLIGAAASPPVDDVDFETITEHVKTRALALNAAGLLAAAREEGSTPSFQSVSDTFRKTASPAGHDNTSFHYALELTEILQGISRLSFVFDSPGIKTQAAPGVIQLLKEATRTYLFGLSRSCVCICRALLEAALRDGVPEGDLLQERNATKKGELECLIAMAVKHRRLPSPLVARAHAITRAGNAALHGSKRSDSAAWEVLQDTRTIIATLYAAA